MPGWPLCATDWTSATGDPDRAAFTESAGGRLVPAGAAQADRGRPGRGGHCAVGYPACTSTSSAADGGWTGWFSTPPFSASPMRSPSGVTSMTPRNTLWCNAVGCMCCHPARRAGGWRWWRRPSTGCCPRSATANPAAADSVIDGVTGIAVRRSPRSHRRPRTTARRPGAARELGAKAVARSREFSWQQSAAAMRTVCESVHGGRQVSGIL